MSKDKKRDQDITRQSKEGTLHNGRRYKYFGTDENTFDLKSFVEKHGLKRTSEYSMKKYAKTPEQAAEIAQRFGLEETPVESVYLNVYYDVKTDNWVIIKKSAHGVSLGGNSIFTIQRNEGLIKEYFDGYR